MLYCVIRLAVVIAMFPLSVLKPVIAKCIIFLFVRYWAKACAVLTCLLGTTWLLGLFFVGEATVVMAYLFNIFNVLQVNNGVQPWKKQ